GMVMAVVPLSMGITAPLSGSLSDRWGTRPLAVAGLAMLLIGYLAVSRLDLNTTPAVYMLSFLPVGVGMGLFQSPNNSAIMGSAPRQRLGVVSGLLSLTRTLGQTSGIAIMGAIWSGLTLINAGPAYTGEGSTAPLAARMVAQQQTVSVVVVIIAIALSLSIWALVSEKRARSSESIYLNTTGK
nr:MFS transporter [Anaerolineaceae bacterium]